MRYEPWVRVIQRHLCACLSALLLVVHTPAAAESLVAKQITVLYPVIGEPYRSIFAKMIEGIEDQARGRINRIAIGTEPNQQEIANDLRRHNARVLIALGRHGLNAVTHMERDLGISRIVVGGVISVQEADVRNYTVASLTPDPALLLTRLQAFMPLARRVFVVYDPGQNAWLIRLAKIAANARGINLVAYEATDFKTALLHYQKILATMESARDALWLPPDSTTVFEASVLLVLQEAWDRNLTVFSSNLAHVRRGALFSLYPNNLEAGRTLAKAALGTLASAGAAQPGVTPLKALHLAVNVRTAAHLGLNLVAKQADFDLVFPEK